MHGHCSAFVIVDFEAGCFRKGVKNGPKVDDIFSSCTNQDESVIDILEDRAGSIDQGMPDCAAIFEQA